MATKLARMLLRLRNVADMLMWRGPAKAANEASNPYI
jgi:hypothetical protein